MTIYGIPSEKKTRSLYNSIQMCAKYIPTRWYNCPENMSNECRVIKQTIYKNAKTLETCCQLKTLKHAEDITEPKYFH